MRIKTQDIISRTDFRTFEADTPEELLEAISDAAMDMEDEIQDQIMKNNPDFIADYFDLKEEYFSEIEIVYDVFRKKYVAFCCIKVI